MQFVNTAFFTLYHTVGSGIESFIDSYDESVCCVNEMLIEWSL